MHSFQLRGQLVDLHQRRTYPAIITVENGRITAIEEGDFVTSRFILPGFVDAHVHIESSMLVPAAFARLAVVHGTVATVSDPHEIANVCGAAGVQYMIDNAAQTPFKTFFGAPSCVPATGFETAGAVLDAAATAELLARPDIWYLAEMMNYPGVLNGDAEVLAKIDAAQQLGKPVDGHAPGLRGEAAHRYAAAGISTDHECITLAEALDKIGAGMHILIREGSAAKNFEALHPLLGLHPERVMFCSDDKHPDELMTGHINVLVRRALALGYDRYDVLRAACLNPVRHYGLPVGLLQVGDPADCVVVEDWATLQPVQTWIGGELVAENGSSRIAPVPAAAINHFEAGAMRAGDFRLPAPVSAGSFSLRAIEALDGQLLTRSIRVPARVAGGEIASDPENDILKIAVINRYAPGAKPAIAFIRGFGLRTGALASTVAHDCHNIIAVGVDDESICAAVNALVAAQGGIAVAAPGDDAVQILPLPIAGLMTGDDGYTVGARYGALDAAAKALGSPLSAPFMTLSFMALLVIPSLKLSDRGLFDGERFSFEELVAR